MTETMSTFEEERGEVWAAILEAACGARDAGREAASLYLLRHMAASENARFRRFGYDGLQPGGDIWDPHPQPPPRASRPSGRSR
jgi:hypothetical protein